MAKAYSADMRGRVIAEVEGGASRREAAEGFELLACVPAGCRPPVRAGGRTLCQTSAGGLTLCQTSKPPGGAGGNRF